MTDVALAPPAGHSRARSGPTTAAPGPRTDDDGRFARVLARAGGTSPDRQPGTAAAPGDQGPDAPVAHEPERDAATDALALAAATDALALAAATDALALAAAPQPVPGAVAGPAGSAGPPATPGPTAIDGVAVTEPAGPASTDIANPDAGDLVAPEGRSGTVAGADQQRRSGGDDADTFSGQARRDEPAAVGTPAPTPEGGADSVPASSEAASGDMAASPPAMPAAPAAGRPPAPQPAAAATHSIPTTSSGAPGSEPWQQVEHAIGTLRHLSDGSEQIQVRLHPDELGEVLVDVTAIGGELRIQLTTDNPAARSRLTADLDQLAQRLAQSGLTASSLDVGTRGDSGTGRPAASPPSDRFIAAGTAHRHGGGADVSATTRRRAPGGGRVDLIL